MKTIPVFLIMLIAFTTLFANEPAFTIGPSVGIIRQSHVGAFNFGNPYDTSANKRYGFTSNSVANYNYRLGLSSVIMISAPNKLSIGVNLGYSHSGLFSEVPGRVYSVRLENGDSVAIRSRFSGNYNQSIISTDFNLRYKPFEQNGFGVNGGLSFSYITNSKYDYRNELVFNETSPGKSFNDFDIDLNQYVRGYKAKFSDDSHTSIIMYQGDLPDINPFQLSLQAGIFYDLYMGNCVFSPNISYHFPLTRVSSSQDLKITELCLSVDFRVII